MLNTKKLLYILPDAAYIAEVLPTKKPHTFSIHAFRQINGQFMDENEFIAENVQKLIHKLDPEEYSLILPDFLFTNTIIDVKETKESAVKEYIKEKLLPSLDLSKETHEIDTFILTQHGGKSKIQLSALEKSVLDPIRGAIGDQKVVISHISPLSWTIKSIISLEPSLSTIQIGEMLYLALHYIGVDQTISFSITETANIVETVKTLKGAEPNIQTMYLLTNGVVEQEIKDQLSGTLPIQQLTNTSDETEGIPSFIKQIIQAGARTLDLPEQPIPRFSLGKDSTSKTKEAKVEIAPLKEESLPEVTHKKQMIEEIEDEPSEDSVLPPPSLPMPTVAAVAAVVPHLEKTNINPETENPKLSMENRPKAQVLSLDEDDDEMIEEEEEIITPIKHIAQEEITITHQVTEGTTEDGDELSDVTDQVEESETEAEVESETESEPETDDLFDQTNERVVQSLFAPDMKNKTPTAPKTELVPDAPTVLPSSYKTTMIEKKEVEISSSPTASPSPRKVIKNNNDAGALFKIILITLGALITTVVVGVGIGFGLLKLSEKNNSGLDANPVVQTSASPVAVASPSPSPSPSPVAVTIDKMKFKILVVNATTVAGQAGKVKTSLTTAGFKSIATGNAKGAYSTKGNFLLVEDSQKGTLSSLTKDSGLTLTLGTDKKAEDPSGTYDAVIVIAE